MPYSIAKQIKNARIARGLSLRQLSKKTGIAISNLSRLEKGIHSPSIKTLKKVSKALGLELNLKLKPSKSNTYKPITKPPIKELNLDMEIIGKKMAEHFNLNEEEQQSYLNFLDVFMIASERKYENEKIQRDESRDTEITQ